MNHIPRAQGHGHSNDNCYFCDIMEQQDRDTLRLIYQTLALLERDKSNTEVDDVK